MTSRTVAVLGLGPMGAAIAAALGDAHEVRAWSRTPRPDVDTASSAADAVSGADIVLVSVVDNDAARAVLAPVADRLSGPVVVNLSSDTPTSADDLASWAEESGLRYLGGTMVTPSSAVGTAASTMLVGGPSELLDEVRPVLELVAPTVIRLGDSPGTVAGYDLALLAAFWTTVTGWCHAVALGQAHGISAADLTERLDAIVRLAADVGATISHDADAGAHPGDVSTIRSASSTVRHIVAATRDAGAAEGVPAAILDLLDAAEHAGHADDGPSVLVPIIRAGGE